MIRCSAKPTGSPASLTGLMTIAPWGDGRVTAGVQSAQVKNNEQLPHDCEDALALAMQVEQSAGHVLASDHA